MLMRFARSPYTSDSGRIPKTPDRQTDLFADRARGRHGDSRQAQSTGIGDGMADLGPQR
jgi:hypothetical protein